MGKGFAALDCTTGILKDALASLFDKSWLLELIMFKRYIKVQLSLRFRFQMT